MKKILTALACLIILSISMVIISNQYTIEEQKEEPVDIIEPEPSVTVPISTTSAVTTKVTQKTTKKNSVSKKVYSNYKVATASKAEYMAYAKSIGGYNDTQMQCLDWLWTHESGWNPNSHNTKTDCCGIPQSHPCSKIKKQQGSMDWQAQIRWGINYIAGRYNGNPCSAWNHFKNSKPHGY